MEYSDEILAKIPNNFSKYIIENNCLPSEVYSDVWSYIFFLNENNEKIKYFSEINTKTRAFIVQNPFDGSKFLESAFCNVQKCEFPIKDEKKFEEKPCESDATIFGHVKENWNETLNKKDNILTLSLAGHTGEIPIIYGSTGTGGCEALE